MLLSLIAFAVGSEQPINASDENFSCRAGDQGWNPSSDLNGDGIIDGMDLALRTLPLQNRSSVHRIEYRADRLLVKFSQKETLDRIRDNMTRLGVDSEKVRSLSGIDYSIVPVPSDQTVEVFLEALKKSPYIENAQFDYICRISKTPNDEYYDIQWNFRHIGCETAWDLASGGDESVVVAVIDTGIAYENHDEFERAPDFAGASFVHPYDFVNDDNHANDDEGHGTHVAGTIAQTTNNGMGTAGLAYECALMPVKVMDSNGSGTSSSLAQGIRWAADKGAAVINMSLGFTGGSDGGAVVREAVSYAYGKGVIMVASSGNEAGDPGYKGGVNYPAAFDQCVAVGAIRFDKRYTYYSNYGPQLDCVAPGGVVTMDQNGDGHPDGILQQTFVDSNPTKFRYVYYQGTSMAAPHAAAAAALFVSRNGGGPVEFLRALKETCDDLGSGGFDERYGYGLINLPGIVRKGQGWGAN